MLLRYGIGISVICHGAALIGLMFVSAAPFDSRPAEAITVDIVTPDEVPSIPAVPPPELNAEAASETSLQQASAPPPSPEPPPNSYQPQTSAPLPAQSAAETPAKEPIRQSPAMPAQSPSKVPVGAGAQLDMANLFGMPVTLPGGAMAQTSTRRRTTWRSSPRANRGLPRPCEVVCKLATFDHTGQRSRIVLR